MACVRINITVPEELLHELDAAVQVEHANRSAYIREAVNLKLRLEAAIESEVTDRESMLKIVTRLHAQRLNKRHINEAGPLTWTEVQD